MLSIVCYPFVIRAATRRYPFRPAWKLQVAKVWFSELVRRAYAEGLLRVIAHGRDAVVVIAAEPRSGVVADGGDKIRQWCGRGAQARPGERIEELPSAQEATINSDTSSVRCGR